MVKQINVIDENQFFVESKKAIQVVLEKDELLRKQMKIAEKHQLVKEHMKKASSLEEFEELKKLEKELRFMKTIEPAVPEEYREKIKRNAVVEQLEVSEKLNELKAQLKDQIEYLENELVPLIDNIRKLEKLGKIPDQINAILDLTIGEEAPFTAKYRLQVLKPSYDETKAGEAIQALNDVIRSLEKIHVPVETKGLLGFLKRGKK